MGELTGKKRISAAFKKTFSDQEPELDRVPTYMFTGSCNAQLVGASIGELLEKGKVFAKAQAAAYERYKPDIMLMMWDLNLEGQAMGNELRFPTDSMTVVTKAAIGDDKGKLSSLDVPDPHKDGRLPEYIDACVETKKVVTTSPVSGVIAGPWTIAMEIRGASNLMVDSLKDPDYVHEVMALCTQTSIRFTEALSEIGVGIGYSEAPASCDLISPDMYRKFVFPYHKQIVDHFKANKIGVGLHVCGNANGILEDLVKAGVSNLSVDSGTDLALAAEAARGKAVLIGNVPTNTFLADSKDVMKAAVQECLEKAPKDSGYILASGCEVPAIAPPEKIDWFMELAGEVGSYS
jgi:uroporphyrinogen decarboxylase